MATNPVVEVDLNCFLCPITRQPMKEPVIAMDGHSYEKSAIERWFQKSDKSPVTNATISKMLIPNLNLKRQLRLASSQIQRVFQNYFAYLPTELLLLIFSFLDADSLLRCAQVDSIN